jgi:hypothetical protein
MKNAGVYEDLKMNLLPDKKQNPYFIAVILLEGKHSYNFFAILEKW